MSCSSAFSARLIEARPLSDSVRHCVFEVQDRERFDFQPGQHVRLTLDAAGRPEYRCYSIASAPGPDPLFELCLAFDQGPTGRSLAEAKPGACFRCSGPHGEFRLRSSPRSSLFIANGTGVAPLKSMIEHLLGGSEDRSRSQLVRLLLGARTPDRLLYRERFQQLEAEKENFAFRPAISRPDSSWRSRTGRVQDHLDDVLGEFGDTTPDVYLCGLPKMVYDLRKRLAEAGVDEDAVFFEQY
jgi:NAD(P)H-flavin reductase